jgi:hypothetical protein
MMWPQIVNWHVQNLPTITGIANVYDGPPVTGDEPNQYIVVGATATGDTGGDAAQTYGEDGFGLYEDGTILCDVVAQTGDVDVATMRTQAFALVDSWNAALRADRTLGGLMNPNNNIELTVTPIPVQNNQGSAVRLLVTVSYHCEIWS